jgi:serine/threonine protein kinase
MERGERSLRDELVECRDGKTFLSATRATDALHSVARALAFLHDRRVPLIHRDVKSENVLVVKGASPLADRFVLTDFDEATQLGPAAARPTRPPMNVGTLEFMAPEVIGDRAAGPTTGGELPYGTPVDVWSFGMVIFEVLTNRLPFASETQTAFEKRSVILSGMLPELPKVNLVAELDGTAAEDVGRQLLKLHHKCLRVEEKRRPAASRIVKTLFRLTEELEVQAITEAAAAATSSTASRSPPSFRSLSQSTPTLLDLATPTAKAGVGGVAAASPSGVRRPFSLRSFAEAS